jgi:hypothetical protein
MKLDQLEALTGWICSWVELIKAAERDFAQMRLLNCAKAPPIKTISFREDNSQNKTDRPLPSYHQDRANMAMPRECTTTSWAGMPKAFPPEKLAELGIATGKMKTSSS